MAMPIWLKMPRRSNPGFALACRAGVNKGPGFWFALFLSLLSGYQPELLFGIRPPQSGSQRTFVHGPGSGLLGQRTQGRVGISSKALLRSLQRAHPLGSARVSGWCGKGPLGGSFGLASELPPGVAGRFH